MKTDERVKHEVVTELNWELPPDAGKICVAVKEGVVTLTGHVSSYAEKWDAERAALRVSVDQVVATAVAADPPDGEQHNDLEMAHCAQGVLPCAAYLPGEHFQVVVAQRRITLTGTVDRSDPGPSVPVEAGDPPDQADAPGCDTSDPRTVINRITVG